MNRTEELFFYILSAVVQDAALETQRFNAMTPEKWAELFRLSKTQGVTAVVFEKLSAAFDECEDFPRPPKALTLNWYAQSQSIERKMATIHKRSGEFAGLMEEKGLHTLVLKGIAVSTYYPNPLHREFGDLDCYLFEQLGSKIIWNNAYEKGNIAAEIVGADVRRGFYKHSHIKFKNFEIENHQFSLPIKDGKATKDLERHLRKIASPIKLEETKGLYMPSANFNALFLTAHAMNHFLYESIKVRHVLDWALFIKTEYDNVDWTIFWQWCEKMHYTRFVECLNRICEKYLGVEFCGKCGKEKPSLIKNKLEELSDRMLRDIFTGQSIYTTDYGYFHFRIILAMSYLKSLWKYQQIYQKSALWLLFRRALTMPIRNVRLEEE